MARPRKYVTLTIDDLTHSRWCAMHTRVRNQDRHKHAVITPEWFCFITFKKDMGECPNGYSLERINNDLGYNKNNCKWIPIENQNKNKRSNIMLYGKPLKELAELIGEPYKTVWNRVRRQNMTPTEALLYRATSTQRKQLEDIRDSFNL